jgi:hypothetical protein
VLTVVIRKAFGTLFDKRYFINLPNSKYELLNKCVWRGPKGFSSKPALRQVYGRELNRLFREILKVPNVTGTEARKHLKQLKDDESTTIADVA